MKEVVSSIIIFFHMHNKCCEYEKSICRRFDSWLVLVIGSSMGGGLLSTATPNKTRFFLRKFSRITSRILDLDAVHCDVSNDSVDRSLYYFCTDNRTFC